MENSWRFHPIQGNICPTCSVSHFPFCPQSSPLDRSGFPQARFPLLDTNPAFHGPFHDPFPGNRPMPGSIPHLADPRFNPNPDPIVTNDIGPMDTSQPWNRIQFTDSSISRPGSLPMHFDYCRGRIFPVELDERIHKKNKVGDVGFGSSFTRTTQSLPVRNDYALSVARISSEDERRLSLIRDHGGQSKPLPKVGMGLFEPGLSFSHPGFSDIGGRSNMDNIHQVSPQDQRNLGSEWRSHSVFGALAGKGLVLPSELAFRQEDRSMQIDSYGANHIFPGAYNSQGDRVTPYENNEFHSGEGTRNGQQRMQSDNRDGFYSEVESAHGSREENSRVAFYNLPNEHYHHDQYIQYHGPGKKYGEQVHQSSKDSATNRPEDHAHHLLGHDHQGSYENYHAYDQPPVQPNEDSAGIPMKQPQYPHTAAWQVPNLQQQEQKSSCLPVENHLPNTLPALPPYTMQHAVGNRLAFYGQKSDVRTQNECKGAVIENIQRPVEAEQNDARNLSRQGAYSLMPTGSSMGSREPPVPPPSHFQPTSLPPTTCPALFPVCSSATAPSSLSPGNQGFPEVKPSSQAYFNKPLAHSSAGFNTVGSQSILQTPSKHLQYVEERRSFPSKHLQPDKPKVIDASHLFRLPHRAIRPDRIVIILRGLPGSGKSYLAKMLRDLEVENGGNAPRIHSMDDYFMTEVEKVEEIEGSKSSSSGKSKKRIPKKVMEYCYEPEMEEAYRSSMLKAFKKTLEEGIFTSIIVDDRNLRVADFAQFWAIAKRSGYEVYLLEATYKDPVGCAARNVHGFTFNDIQKMADQWEQAPPLYLQLDIQSLSHGDDLNKNGIQEVDMDMEDEACENGVSGEHDKKSDKAEEQPLENYAPDAGERWDTETDDPKGVKELGSSKWSEDVDEDIGRTEGAKRNLNALSGLIQAYTKGEKSVRWGDWVEKSGFSIGAVKKTHTSSLLIGPGAGYNLDSNPLPEDSADINDMNNTVEPKRRSTFLEQLRAERESFRAVFDKRRQRISGLKVDEE